MKIVPCFGPLVLIERLVSTAQHESEGANMAILCIERKLKQRGITSTADSRRECLASFVSECCAAEDFKVIVLVDFPRDKDEARWLIDTFEHIIAFESEATIEDASRLVHLSRPERLAVESEIMACKTTLQEVRPILMQKIFPISGSRAIHAQARYFLNRITHTATFKNKMYSHVPES